MTTKKPAPSKGNRYSDSQKIEALAALATNNGNITKTARQTGVSRDKLREWQGSEIATSPEIVTLKAELQDERRTLMREVLHAGLHRALALLPTESDLFKVTGLVKVMSELRITEEVADDYSRSASELPATPGPAVDTSEGRPVYTGN